MDHWQKFHEKQHRDEIAHRALSIIFYTFITLSLLWYVWVLISDTASEVRYMLHLFEQFNEQR